MSRARYSVNPSRETASDIGRIMRRAQELDHQAPVAKHRRRKTPWVLAAFSVLMAFTGFNVYRTLHPDPVAVDPQGPVTDIRFEMYVAVQHLDAFRQKHGRLPGNLEARGMMDRDITYTVEGDSYSLMGFLQESTVTYTDGDDLEPLKNAVNELFGEEKP